MAGGTLTISAGLFAAGAFGSSSDDFPGVVHTDAGEQSPATLLNAPPAAPLDPTATPGPSSDSTELAAAGAGAPSQADESGDSAPNVVGLAPNQPASPPAAPTDTPPTETPPAPAPVQPTPVPPTPVPVPPTPVPPAPTQAPPPVPTQAPPPPASVALHPMEQAMFSSHNAQRGGASLGGLTLDARLTQAARQRAQDMASKSYFSHTSPSGETAFTILHGLGYPYQLAGENIARNNFPDSETVQTAMNGFMNSAGHRANILETGFARVGIGVAFGADGMKYFAVVFSN